MVARNAEPDIIGAPRRYGGPEPVPEGGGVTASEMLAAPPGASFRLNHRV